MVLTVLFLSNATIILLDEPGKTLHPVLLRNLQQKIFTPFVNDKTLLYTTHSTELLGKHDLYHIIRCVKNATDHTQIIYLESLLETSPNKTQLEHFCSNPEVKSMFFSKQVCFLEGVTDEQVLKALIYILTEQGYKFKSDIIVLHGKGDIVKAAQVANHLQAEWVLIADFDAWNAERGNKSVSESKIGKVLSEHPSFDASVYDVLKQTNPNDRDVRKELHEIERKYNVFTWKSDKDKGDDLESAIQETDNSFTKADWKQKPYHEVIELVKTLVNKKNKQKK